MKKILFFIGSLFTGIWLFGQNAWINEFHYDNVSTDVGEFVEIVIENPGDFSLSDFKLYLYNGSGGVKYDSLTVDNCIVGSTEGNFTFYYWEPSSIQNGPDGIALSYQGTLITGQFLSYEGTFTATDGPANGTTSTDVGVSETSSTPSGYSLQLSGTGTQYSDFTWQNPAAETEGALNNGQAFGTSTTSNESDIIKTSGWSEPTNIDYTLYSASSGLTTSNSIEVGKFTIRDGGASASDADEEATILTAITFSISKYYNIEALAIFDGSSNIAEVTSVNSSTAFTIITGLSAPDDGTKDFSVYATFKTTVTDNDNLKFTVNSVTADPSGSTFADSDAGGASTDDTGDNNKLVVTADRLAITTPSSVLINTDFNVDVEATDANGSRDLDETSSVTIALSSGTGTISSVTGLTKSLSSGSYSWTDVQYDVAEDFTIEAQSASLSNATSGTITALSSVSTDLIISELCSPNDGAAGKFVELYNIGNTTIDFSTISWYLCRQSNGGSTWGDIQLSGSVAPGETFIVAYGSDFSNFNSTYGFDPDQSNTGINGNGNDGYFLYYNGDHSSGTLIDAFGVIDQNGTDTEWDYTSSKAVRLRSVTTPSTVWTASEWDIPSTASSEDMTPGAHGEDVSWQATATGTDWNTKSTDNWGGTNGYIPDASFNVTVEASSPYFPEISSEVACNDLTLNSDAALTLQAGIPFTVYGDLDVASSKSSRAAASFTIDGDATGNGSVIVEGSVTGDATVVRYFQGYDDGSPNGWHDIGSPVNNMVISGSDFDPTGTSDDLYQWNESTDTWENYQQGHFSNFVNGSGYLCAFQTSGARAFVGTLNNSDIDKTNLSMDGDGWHLLGNPFASAVEWNNGEWTLSNITGTAQIWDEDGGNYTVINANDIIPSTSGFFIQVSSATNSITIPASARVHSIVPNYKSQAVSELDETLVLKVTNDENSYYDISRIGFRADATEDWDIAFDAHKLFGNDYAPQLWTVTNNDIYAQNYLPYPAIENSIPLDFKAGVNGTYHIDASGLNSFSAIAGIYLEDLIADKIIDLNEQSFYTFTATTDDDEARFLLHFSGITGVNETPEIENTQIYAYQNKVYVKFDQMPKNDYTVEVINMIGQQVFTEKFAPATFNSLALNEKDGIYFVRLHNENKTSVQKIIIKN